MANSVDPDQTAPIGAVCSGSTLFASILNSSVMLGNYLQQMTSHGLQSRPPSPKRAERKVRRRPFREAGSGQNNGTR